MPKRYRDMYREKFGHKMQHAMSEDRWPAQHKVLTSFWDQSVTNR